MSLIALALGAATLTRHTSHFPLMLSWAQPVLLAGLVLAAARPSVGKLSDRIDAGGFAAFAWAATAGVLTLLIPVIVLIRPNAADAISDWTYPIVDKRWLITLYGIGLVGVLVLPVALRRLFPAEIVAPKPAEPPNWFLRIAGIAVVCGFAWLVAGPPWNVERRHMGIDYHEMVHLGPLQAIDKGRMPFIGPAATQYGPGSQLLTYEYMKRRDRFTIVGFREASLLFNLVAIGAVGLVALWLIDLPSALLVMILALAYSPVRFFMAVGDGTFVGFYGWANTLRYLGALLVVPGSVMLAGRVRSRWLSIPHVLFGVTWGFFAWVSQENLTATLTAGGLSILLLLLSRTITLRQTIAVVLSMVGGFAVFWLPLLLLYWSFGHASEFVANYFRVAGAVTAGFSNTWWIGEAPSADYTAYRWTPCVIAATGLLTLWDLPRLRLREPLSTPQVRLLTFVAVLAASYTTALFRSDNTHLINTLLPLPFVLTLAFRDLPSWTAATIVGRGLVRLAVVAVALSVYPVAPLLGDLHSLLIKPSLIRFGAGPPPPANTPGVGVAFTRATPYLSDEPGATSTGGFPMRQFLEEASGIHDLVGDRQTFVTNMGGLYTGLVYFMADLTPADGLLERETMTINKIVAEEVFNEYRRRVRDIECLIVSDMGMREVAVFQEAHPQARVEQRTLAGQPVFILLADPR